MLGYELWGNTVQDYLISLAIMAGGVAMGYLISHVLRRWLLKAVAHTATHLDDMLIQRAAMPVSLLVMVGMAYIAVARLHLGPVVEKWVVRGLQVVAIALVFILVMRLVRVMLEFAAGIYLKGLSTRRPEVYEQQKETAERVKKQLVEVTNMFLGVLGILTIVSAMGVDLGAVWASLGIGGIALVVAVQEPLRNLVGRLYIYSTGIFDEGHFIRFGQWAGTVKRIGLFRTYLELFTDMTTVSIPNAEFVKGVVKNYFGRRKFMYKWDLDVPYEVPADRIQQLVEEIRKLVLAHPEVNPDMCWIYLERLDRYSKVVRVWFQAKLASWADSLYYGNRMLTEIQQLFERMGISFAFPTQTIHIEGAPVPVALPQLEDKGPQGEEQG